MSYKKLTLSTKLPFGKYSKELVYDVIKKDPDYIKWLSSNWKGEVDWKINNWLTKNA